jgi:hypothetical protein
MKRVLLSAFFVCVLAAPLAADVTIVATGSGKALGLSNEMTTKTYVKGLKMRSDTIDGNRTSSIVFDVDDQKIYMFDNRRKEADVWDMAAFAEQMNKTVDTGDIEASMKPNGKTKEVSGRTTHGYDIHVSVPFTMGGPDGPAMTLELTGVAWIAKGAPGSADYARFYRAAADKGFIFSDPRAAKGAPGPPKAMAEMYRQMADTGGIPFEFEMQTKSTGSGPMAMLGRMMNVSATSTTQAVEVGPLADDLFAPPAGYKLRVQKQ